MRIESAWRLTFDPAGTPLVLVAYDDEIEGEPRWPLGRGLDVVALVDSQAPFLRPSGNQTVTLQIDVYTPETTDAAARQKIMESLIAVALLSRKPLKVEIKGITDRYWQFATCYIPTFNPGRDLDAPGASHVKSYSLTCTGLAQVGPP